MEKKYSTTSEENVFEWLIDENDIHNNSEIDDRKLRVQALTIKLYQRITDL